MVLNEQTKNIIIAVLLVLVCLFAYTMFGSGDQSKRLEQVERDIQSVRNELADTRREISESRSIVNSISELNSTATSEIRESRAINQSSVDLCNEGRSIISRVQQGAKENPAEVKN